jgi:hypothetical protein
MFSRIPAESPFEISNVTFSGSNCSASLNIWEVVSGDGATWLGSSTIPCQNGMQVHAVIAGSWTQLYLNGVIYTWLPAVTDLPVGQPGIGGRDMPAGNSISEVDLGPHVTTPPNAVNPQTIGTSSFPDHVDVQWQGVGDPSGIGLALYWIVKDGQTWYMTQSPEFTDETVTPSSTHTYEIIPDDWHNNLASGTSFTITAPPSGAIDPRRTGVQPLGTYWGDMGEQIDVRSLNLNFSVPVLTAQGRGAWSVPFGLGYNSQQW